MKKKGKVIAVVPAYNEEKRIAGVLRELRKYVDEIRVSDDGSTDRTAEIAKKAGARVISSPVNMGVGHATRLGCDYAVEKLGADVIVLIDADGQHSPSDIPRLLKKIGDGHGFVFTNRLSDFTDMPLVKIVGNHGLSFLTNLIAGTSVQDTQSGFKAFSADAYKRIGLTSDGYEVCSEFVIKVGRNGITHCQVPIGSEYDEWTRIKGAGFLTGITIFMRIIRIILTK
jgi:UDP-N-acetylglucosamine---dolichyl-phosphate N-acetylglucosaminyltransferase